MTKPPEEVAWKRCSLIAGVLLVANTSKCCPHVRNRGDGLRGDHEAPRIKRGKGAGFPWRRAQFR